MITFTEEDEMSFTFLLHKIRFELFLFFFHLLLGKIKKTDFCQVFFLSSFVVVVVFFWFWVRLSAINVKR